MSREGDDFRRLFRDRTVALGTHSGGGGQHVIMAMRMQFSFLGCIVLGRRRHQQEEGRQSETINAMLNAMTKEDRHEPYPEIHCPRTPFSRRRLKVRRPAGHGRPVDEPFLLLDEMGPSITHWAKPLVHLTTPTRLKRSRIFWPVA